MEKAKTENTTHKQCILLVETFCKPPINWGREIKIAKKLLVRYSLDLLIDIDMGDFKLFSLSYFLTEKGRQKIIETEQHQKALEKIVTK